MLWALILRAIARAVDRLDLLAARAKIEGDLARHRLKLGLRCKTCGGVVKVQWYRCPNVSETDEMLASCHGNYEVTHVRDDHPHPMQAIANFLDRASSMPRRKGVFGGAT